LLGGFKQSEAWIDVAQKAGIDWWVTSALESNIGLNAIAQWTYSLGVSLPQGLGTGSLFTNNIESHLIIEKGCLGIDNSITWSSI
jgi:O-succinylbenzoate synthase